MSGHTLGGDLQSDGQDTLGAIYNTDAVRTRSRAIYNTDCPDTLEGDLQHGPENLQTDKATLGGGL